MQRMRYEGGIGAELMKNGKIFRGLIALVGLLVANIGIFVFIHKYFLTFWISYGFLMAAFLVNICVHIFVKNTKPLIFGYSLGAVAAVYLIAEIIAAVIFFALSPFAALPAFLVQLIILVAFGICYLQVLMTSAATARQQEIRGRDIMNFKDVLERMRSVQSKIPYEAPYKKTVEHAYDSLAGGQVRSNREADEIERKILDEIHRLDAAVSAANEEEICAGCVKLERLAEERKEVLNRRELF